MMSGGQQTFEDWQRTGRWLSNDDIVNLLTKLMDEKFTARDTQISALRADMTLLSTEVGGLKREMSEFKDVAADLRDVAESLSQARDAFAPVVKVAHFAMAKKTWGAVAGVWLVVSWLADHMPPIHWPF